MPLKGVDKTLYTLGDIALELLEASVHVICLIKLVIVELESLKDQRL